MILALLAALSWGVEALLVDWAGLRFNPILGTGVGCIAAGGVFLGYILVTGNREMIASASPLPVLVFAIAGILAFALGHAVYYMAINTGQVNQVVPVVASYPLFAILLSAVVLQETITLRSAIGALLVFGGVLLITT